MRRCTIADMPEGSLGKTDDGRIYFRTMETAACLNDYGATYSGLACIRAVRAKVTLYPDGTKIVLTVKAPVVEWGVTVEEQ